MGTGQEPVPRLSEGKPNQLAVLERRLAQALAERDGLARDVESLCLETSANTTFSYSSVLQERIFSADKELSRTKLDLLEVTGQRDSLQEDVRGVREAKRLADHAYRELSARMTTLERELAFYRKQAAQAIADRDASAWECEELRRKNLQLDARARHAEGRAEAASAERSAAERRLAQEAARSAALATTAAEAAALPALRADLSKARSQLEALQQESAAMKADLSEKRLALHEAAAAQEQAQQELEEVAGQKVGALLRLSEAELARAKLEPEVERLRGELATTRVHLEQATQEKVAALMQAADLKSAAEPTNSPTTVASNDGGSSQSSLETARWRPTSWFGVGSPVKATPAEGQP